MVGVIYKEARRDGMEDNHESGIELRIHNNNENEISARVNTQNAPKA